MIEVITSKHKKDLQAAADWYVEVFMGNYSDEYIRVQSIWDAEEAVDSYGFCYEEDDYILIEINVLGSLEEKLIALFHELTHAMQILTGRLTDYTWLGEDKDKYPDYATQPWEVEAHAMEKTVYKAYTENF